MPPLRPTLLLAATALALSACSDDGGGVAEGRTPEEVLELAKKTLDETSGVRLALTTDDLPDGVTGVKSATGVGTHAPAFEGTIGVVLGGATVHVPIVAVDDTVHAQIPFTPGWSDVDPAEYGAPDPAQLLSTEAGFSSLLPATEGAEEGESVRGGEGNKEVLTEYTGSVPGDVVSNVSPTAEGDFDATYTITAEGELREAVLTGTFYPDADSMTYTLELDDYGSEPEISAP